MKTSQGDRAAMKKLGQVGWGKRSNRKPARRKIVRQAEKAKTKGD